MLSTEELTYEPPMETKRLCVTLHFAMPKTALLPKMWKTTLEQKLSHTMIDQISDIVWDFTPPYDPNKHGSFRILTDQALALNEIMSWKTLLIDNVALTITQKDLVEDMVHWHTDHITPTHFTFHLMAVNTASVQMFNTAKYRGMLYDAIENVDPKFAKKLHADPNPSLWNFGTLIAEKFDRCTASSLKGDYTIPQYSHLKWHVSTLYPDIADRIAKIKEMHLGEVGLYVEKCDRYVNAQPIYTEKINAITIQINTPLILFDAETKTYLPITEENVINYQLAKLKKAGIVTTNMTDLHEYIRFLQIPERQKAMTVVLDNGQTRRFEGKMGFLTIKVMGDDLIKAHLYKLFQISQIVGIGSNCNSGFGQNCIKAIR